MLWIRPNSDIFILKQINLPDLMCESPYTERSREERFSLKRREQHTANNSLISFELSSVQLSLAWGRAVAFSHYFLSERKNKTGELKEKLSKIIELLHCEVIFKFDLELEDWRLIRFWRRLIFVLAIIWWIFFHLYKAGLPWRRNFKPAVSAACGWLLLKTKTYLGEQH